MCCRIIFAVLIGLFLVAGPGATGEASAKTFRLSAPDDLVMSGFLKHLLPRFSLKTGIRIEIVPETDTAEAAFSTSSAGTPVFSGLGKDWFFAASDAENEHVERFEDWLTGDVGRKTITSFKPDSGDVFAAATAKPKEVVSEAISGDIVSGEKLAVVHCGRCHMVNEATRLTTIGSSPSFAVMRGFSDWRARFEAFFALNPHPSFTQVEGVTEPFHISRPSPIAPLELTLDELDAILAFVSRIPPADLGAPIQYQ
ncbi:hypothetical protein [uncultured Roseibium sp.]|uniref:hypothetical protein n=1 Tax=uncultured Roseibium sp. TaxID=1936171 RepID=UPI0026019BEC|nr:hypothetical protein [uncultured Roseibium sp.]